MCSELLHLLISPAMLSRPLLLSHNRLWGVLLTSSHIIVFSPPDLLYLISWISKTSKKKNHTMRWYRIFSLFFRSLYKHMHQKKGGGRKFGNRADHQAWNGYSVWSRYGSCCGIPNHHGAWLLFCRTDRNNADKALHRGRPEGMWWRRNKHEFLGVLLFSGNLVKNSVALISYLHYRSFYLTIFQFCSSLFPQLVKM